MIVREDNQVDTRMKKHGHDNTHGPVVTDDVKGEIFCGRCGLVLVEKMEDQSNDQRGFSAEQYMEKSRTGIGSTLAMHDMGLATVIDTKDKDASGNSLSGYMKNTFSRLRIWDGRSKLQSTDRNLKSAFVTLSSMKTKIDISEPIAERAAYLYRKALAKKITRGRSIVGLMLASIYAACREANAPRTLQDISSAGNVSVKEISRHYRALIETLDLQIESYQSSDFVSRISGSVGISEKTRRGALDILSKAKEKGITAGKNPMALAAASVYVSSLLNMEQKNQKTISRASGISSVTIRNLSLTLRKNLGMYHTK